MPMAQPGFKTLKLCCVLPVLIKKRKRVRVTGKRYRREKYNRSDKLRHSNETHCHVPSKHGFLLVPFCRPCKPMWPPLQKGT